MFAVANLLVKSDPEYGVRADDGGSVQALGY